MADLSWINPEVIEKKEEWKRLFQETGELRIDNFLKDEKAEFFYQWFTHEMAEDWWYTATFGPEGHGNVDYTVARTARRGTKEEIEASDGPDLDNCHKVAHQKFSYIFDRSMQNHWEECDCPQCSLVKWLEGDCSKFMLELIGYTEDQLKLTGTFLNRYRSGHFLAPHTDTPNGKIGQIYSMVKDWKPQYGGNLFYLNPDGEIREVIKPTFNRMSIFDTNLLPAHFVSHLSPYCPISRISATGWYSRAAAMIEKAKAEAVLQIVEGDTR